MAWFVLGDDLKNKDLDELVLHCLYLRRNHFVTTAITTKESLQSPSLLNKQEKEQESLKRAIPVDFHYVILHSSSVFFLSGHILRYPPDGIEVISHHFIQTGKVFEWVLAENWPEIIVAVSVDEHAQA